MSEYKFFSPIHVRYGDLDPQGHVNNARHLTYFEHARVYYLRELGLFKESDSFLDLGVIMANVNINYHAPIPWSAAIKAGIRTIKIGNKSILTEQCVISHDEQILYASGEVVLVMFDYRLDASTAVPQDWRDAISKFEKLSN